MSKSKVFTFRADVDVVNRVEAQAKLVPRLASEKAPSHHAMARALMMEALRAREEKQGKK